LAVLRAEFGEQAVVQVVLKQGHLPESTFSYQPMTEIKLPVTRGEPALTVTRRMLSRPQLWQHDLNGNGRHGERPLGIYGAVRALQGPFIVSGGWWMKAVHREYHYAEMQRGDLLWVYFDKYRRSWWQQGAVE
jgi:protein ImuB